MHTRATIDAFGLATATLGKATRAFTTKVCPFYKTRELPRETESRKRRKKASAASKAADANPREKDFHLDGIKWHMCGHYWFMVREWGPVGDLSTQTVRLSAISPDCALTVYP